VTVYLILAGFYLFSLNMTVRKQAELIIHTKLIHSNFSQIL